VTLRTADFTRARPKWQQEWGVAAMEIAPAASPVVTAARLNAVLAVPLERLTWRVDDSDLQRTESLLVYRPPALYFPSPRIIMGQQHTPGPLFDAPRPLSLQLGNAKHAVTIDLRASLSCQSCALLHVRVAQRLGRECPSDRGPTLPQRDASLAFPGLRARFDLAYFQAAAADRSAWPDFEPNTMATGFGTWCRVTPEPPLPLLSTQGTPLPLRTMPLAPDRVGHPFDAIVPDSAHAAFLSGGSRSHPWYILHPHPASSTPTARAVAIAQRASDSALAQGRSAALSMLAGRPDSINAFLEQWYGVARWSSTQLLTIQGQLYSLGYYEWASQLAPALIFADPSNIYRPEMPKEALAHFIDSGQWSRAEPLLWAAFAAQPNDPFFEDALRTRLLLRGDTGAMVAFEKDLLRQCLRRRPDQMEEIETRAQRLVALGQGALVQRLIDEWLQEDTATPSAIVMSSLLLHRWGQPGESLRRLRQAVAAFPTARLPRAALIDALMQSGRAVEARREAEAWWPLDPDNPYLLQFLGDVALNQGDAPEALAYFQMLLTATPSASLAYIKVGDALHVLEAHQAASRAYSRALEIQPNDLVPLLRLADAATRAGDFKRAAEAFDKLRAGGASYTYDAVFYAREESYYQLLTQWMAQALNEGDDTALPEIYNRLRASSTYASYTSFGAPYALRVSFLPELTDDLEQTMDFRVREPNGETISSITPYGSLLNSQLMQQSKRGPGPRVYYLPQATQGRFEVRVTFEGPTHCAPLRGWLFVHKVTTPLSHTWEKHEVVLNQPGDAFSVSFALTDPPGGQRHIP